MRLSLILLLILMFNVNLYSLENNYNQNFDKNLGWYEINTEDVYQKIQNGHYIFFKKKNRGTWITAKRINVDLNNDFEISTEISYMKGDENSAYGIIWNAKDLDNYSYIIINQNGFIQYGKKISGENKVILKKSRKIKSKKNKLGLKKEGSKLNFYLNDDLVFSRNFKEISDNRIGYICYKRINIEIDNLIVKGKNTENKKRKVSVKFNYKVIPKGITDKFWMLTNLPDSYSKRQKILKEEFSVKPKRIFIEGENRYAEFEFRNLKEVKDIEIYYEMELYDYDINESKEILLKEKINKKYLKTEFADKDLIKKAKSLKRGAATIRDLFPRLLQKVGVLRHSCSTNLINCL